MMQFFISLLLNGCVLTSLVVCCCDAFTASIIPLQQQSQRHDSVIISMIQDDESNQLDDVTSSSSSKRSKEGILLYPVISRIASKNWTGTCKYIGADLIHLSKLKLTGGVRWDIHEQKKNNNVTLSSYLTFPNGDTREVVMTGGRDGSSYGSTSQSYSPPILTLNPIEGDGPIKMLVSEIEPNTILVNEVDITSGKIIMTCSTSIVRGRNGNEELVQVSHEVGDDGGGIEGHQVWRLTEMKYERKREETSTINEGEPMKTDEQIFGRVYE